MRFQPRQSSVLLLALASAATALVADSIDPRSEAAAVQDPRDVPNPNAPIDGKDGVPHTGPFVTMDGDGTEKPGTPELRAPSEKIDTTGLEGGVSEKDTQRQTEEAVTGEKAPAQPETPKEAPPLPHSEEEKLRDGPGGLDDTLVPEVDASKDSAYEVIDSDVEEEGSQESLEANPKTPSDSGTSALDGHGDEEGGIQPLHSFVLSFTMIMFSEIGDKTFLVAALMAMKHDRIVVFTAAFGALLVMTVLSAGLGQVVPNLISKRFTSFAAAILFLVFGAKLLREGMQMDPSEGVTEEMHEVEQELAEKEKELGQRGPHALEMGINGRASRSKSRFASPPRSPSQSPSRGPSSGVESIKSALQGASNLFSLLLSPAWVQTFVMTFLGEWGDRSQIATIAMAAGDDYWGVTLGALVGHSICTGIAVIGGRAIAGRVSLKLVTVGGAVAFLVFGVIYMFEAMYT